VRLLAEKVVELKIAPKVSTMSVQRALKKMNLLIRHETTATLWPFPRLNMYGSSGWQEVIGSGIKRAAATSGKDASWWRNDCRDGPALRD
jgi:hypothetical protein